MSQGPASSPNQEPSRFNDHGELRDSHQDQPRAIFQVAQVSFRLERFSGAGLTENDVLEEMDRRLRRSIQAGLMDRRRTPAGCAKGEPFLVILKGQEPYLFLQARGDSYEVSEIVRRPLAVIRGGPLRIVKAPNPQGTPDEPRKAPRRRAAKPKGEKGGQSTSKRARKWKWRSMFKMTIHLKHKAPRRSARPDERDAKPR